MFFNLFKDFDSEENYRCFVFGKFADSGYVPRMLTEYGELCADSPKLVETVPVGDWTVIPCPNGLIKRCDFLNLMNWLSQEGHEAFGIAVHEKNSFFAVREKQNENGDTVYVKQDKGLLLKWSLPDGFCEEKPYSKISVADSEDPELLKGDCKNFLNALQANDLIPFFSVR